MGNGLPVCATVAAWVKGTRISDRVRVSVGATVAIEHLGLKQRV